MKTIHHHLKREESSAELEASEAFIQRANGDWTADDETKLQARLAVDSIYAKAFHGMEKSWASIGAHAESPELMKLRQSAIAWIRRENVKRWRAEPKRRVWFVAATAGVAAVALAIVLQLSPYGYRPGLYATSIGQQSKVDLADRSRVELDAATRLQVRFTDTARTVRLLEGQAQFSVAKDPTRPFRVLAGDRAIVALGTVFTVEYVDRKVRVAMLEGKVSVLPDDPEEPSRPGRGGVILAAGEELRVAPDGRVALTSNADIAAATAWRDGNVIFRDEPLSEAVSRLNRYSQVQLKIDDAALATLRINGVFAIGDTGAFARSVEAYYPVVADYSAADAIHLRLK